VPLVYYRPGEWKRCSIGAAEEGIVHGTFVTDWDHNGRSACIGSATHNLILYRNSGNDTAQIHGLKHRNGH
jgi:hypothetical protein